MTGMLKDNLEKVVQHGKRADFDRQEHAAAFARGLRRAPACRISTRLSMKASTSPITARAPKSRSSISPCSATFDPDAGTIDLFPQEITRVLLNLISNGFYAATKRKAEETNLMVTSLPSRPRPRTSATSVEIRIRDNGTGIPARGEGEDVQPVLYDQASR